MPKKSKRENFVKMAEARTSKALKMIQLLGNLNNPQVYEYTTKDIDRISNSLCAAIQDMAESLKSGRKVRFSLKD